MFLTSSDRPIDPELENIVEEIERKSPSLSVLAARQLGYCVSQTPIKIEIAKSRQLNILEVLNQQILSLVLPYSYVVVKFLRN